MAVNAPTVKNARIHVRWEAFHFPAPILRSSMPPALVVCPASTNVRAEHWNIPEKK